MSAQPYAPPWGIVVPTGEPPSQAYADFGRDFLAYTTTADTTGTAQISFPTVPGGEYWLLEHAVVKTNSAAATAARWYLSQVVDVAQIDYTSQGNEDVADWPHGLFVPSGATLQVLWTGASSGARCTVTAVRHIYRQTLA